MEYRNRFSKGDVPVPYIIALVLGVIVIALIAYWLFTGGNIFGGTVDVNVCMAKKLDYCSQWTLTGNRPRPSFSGSDCASVNANKDNYFAPECCSIDGYNKMLDQTDCE